MQEPNKAGGGKHFRKKLKNLAIDIEENDREEFRAQSATNFNSKPFHFNSTEAARRQDIDNTLQKLQRLEQEKSMLLQDLERLKEGAVSALVEKEEVIERLKEKVEEVVQSKEVMGEEKQREYIELLAELEQATSRVDQHKKQIEVLRQQHIAEVTKRDQLIMELGEQLEKAKLHLLELSHSEKTLSEKYKQAQSEKQELEDELVRSRVNLSMLRESLTNSQPAISENGNDDHSLKSHNIMPKIEQSSHYRLKTDESEEIEQNVNKKEWDTLEKQELDRLREENEKEKGRHAREMEELKRYYEDKLEEAIRAKQNQSKSIPKTQSVLSIARRKQQKSQQRTPMADLRNELLTNLRTDGSCQQDNQSAELNHPEQDVDKCEALSQFSGKYFSYQKIPEAFAKDPKKKAKLTTHDVIHQTPPHDERDPSFLDWIKSIGWMSWAVGGLLVTGVVFVLRRRK